MSRRTFVVVGAGMGGLATALRLAHRGERVIVLEKTGQVGGRNREVVVGDCSFDGGPTLVMMLYPFRKLFSDVGERLEDHLSLSKCDPSYRVFYSDGARLDAAPCPKEMAERIACLSGPADARGFRRLLADLERLYLDAIPSFVRRNFYSPLDFFGPRQLGLVARHGMLSNLAARVAKYVKDERLRMLFSFQTMYLGLSPFRAPWVYSVLTWMEYGEGIYYPQGGVVEIARAIARLAEEKGTEIRLNAPVAKIEGNRVTLESGEAIHGNAVICNADLPYAEEALLGQTKRRKRRYSCSAFMMYVDYEGDLPALLHHNVFLGPDFRRNLGQIFEQRQLPDEPAFYAAVSSRTDPDKAKDGHINLCLLVPCANLERPWSDEDAQALKTIVFQRLSDEVGFDPRNVRAMTGYSPEDWRADLNLDQGAAFGLSHDFLQSAYFRPSNRSKTNPYLYFVGASTVPGNGLPMVLISAELAEQRLIRDGVIK